MKHLFLPISMFLLLTFAGNSRAQVTNLLVNGSSTSFTMTSGDTLQWSCNIPTGATVTIQIWYDVNGNGKVDSATDVIYQTIPQTDGDTTGHSGPPDMDGQKNGAVLLDMPVGIAPGKYVLVFSEGGTSESVAGTVNPLASPAHTISGTVSVPAGKSAANIFVEASRSDQYQPNFWDGLTNSNGQYSIQMTSDTAGNPWQVSIVNNPYPGSLITPGEQDVTVSGNPSGVDFSISESAAQVVGYLKDESGTPLVNEYITLSRLDTANTMSTVVYDQKTDGNGFFQFGIAASDLIAGRTWRLFAATQDTDITTTVLAAVGETQINAGDSLVKNLTVYSANSQIQGTLTIDGTAPTFPVEVIADNVDSAQAAVYVDQSTGDFSIPVSNKISSYTVSPIFLPGNYNVPSVQAHPGDTGIKLDVTTTAVRTSGRSVPTRFSLGQSYPNPFNPTTTIVYDVASTGKVTIAVYNILGQKVATLVDGILTPGQYSARFDGTRFASGVYLYVMSAGNFSSAKKFVLMK